MLGYAKNLVMYSKSSHEKILMKLIDPLKLLWVFWLVK